MSGYRGPVYELPLADLRGLVALCGLGKRALDREHIALAAPIAARLRDMATVADEIERRIATFGSPVVKPQPSDQRIGNGVPVPTPPTRILGPQGVLGTREVAEYLGVSERRVRQLAPSLGGRRFAGSWQFPAENVEVERLRRQA